MRRIKTVNQLWDYFSMDETVESGHRVCCGGCKILKKNSKDVRRLETNEGVRKPQQFC